MEPERKVFADALAILARRDHSEAELSLKMEKRGIPSATVAAVTARLREQGYLDDRRYAMRWAENAVASGRGYGPKLAFDLYRRGISRGIVSEVIAEISRTHAEMETLAALVRRKFPRFDPSSADEKEKRRVMTYLQRRGFSTSLIWQLLRDQQSI